MQHRGGCLDAEQEYLATAIRLADLLRKRVELHDVQSELEHLHRQSMTLGEAMLTSPEPIRFEQEYIEVTDRIRDVLARKRESAALLPEIARLHGELAALGRQLGWEALDSEPIPAKPVASEMTDRIARLQQQIAGIRTAIA